MASVSQRHELNDVLQQRHVPWKPAWHSCGGRVRLSHKSVSPNANCAISQWPNGRTFPKGAFVGAEAYIDNPTLELLCRAFEKGAKATPFSWSIPFDSVL